MDGKKWKDGLDRAKNVRLKSSQTRLSVSEPYQLIGRDIFDEAISSIAQAIKIVQMHTASEFYENLGFESNTKKLLIEVGEQYKTALYNFFTEVVFNTTSQVFQFLDDDMRASQHRLPQAAPRPLDITVLTEQTIPLFNEGLVNIENEYQHWKQISNALKEKWKRSCPNIRTNNTKRMFKIYKNLDERVDNTHKNCMKWMQLYVKKALLVLKDHNQTGN